MCVRKTREEKRKSGQRSGTGWGTARSDLCFHILWGNCLEEGLEAGIQTTGIGQATDGDCWTEAVKS